MSAWLVDTHALLWFLADDPKLSIEAKQTMESELSELFVSAASVWEIGIKLRLGKLRAPEQLPRVMAEQGFAELAVTADDAWGVTALSLEEHRDPFDRMLVAQSLTRHLPIISGDAALDQYGVTRHW